MSLCKGAIQRPGGWTGSLEDGLRPGATLRSGSAPHRPRYPSAQSKRRKPRPLQLRAMSPIRSACASALFMALFALTGCGGGSDGSDSATAAASVPAAKIPVTAHATGTSIGFHGVAWDGNVFVTVGDVGYA